MGSPLDKTKKELTLFLIEESYKVYRQNFVGSKAFEDIPPPPSPPPLLPPRESNIEHYRNEIKKLNEKRKAIFNRGYKTNEDELDRQAKSALTGVQEQQKKDAAERAKKAKELKKSFQPKKTSDLQEALEEVDRIKTICSNEGAGDLQLACLGGLMTAFAQVEKITNNLNVPIEIPEPVKESKEVVLKPISTSEETLKKKKAFFDFNPEKAQRQELAKEQSLLLSVETQKKKEKIESAIETIKVEIAKPIVNEENVYNLLNYLNEEFSKINLFPRAFIENISSETPSERQLILPEEKEKVVENISLNKKEFKLSKENFVNLLAVKIDQIKDPAELFQLEENEFLKTELTNYKLFDDKELYSLTILLYSLNSELSLSTLNNILQINSYYYIKEEKAENLFFLSEIVIKEEELLFEIKYRPIILKDNTNNREINLSLLIREYITDLLKSDFKILRQANIENNLSDDEKKEAIKTILDEVVFIAENEFSLQFETVSENIEVVKLAEERIKDYINNGILWKGSTEFEIIEQFGQYFLTSDLLNTNKNFHWCGAFIAFCYKDFIKKEIKQKVMPSTYRFAIFAQDTKRHLGVQSLIKETSKIFRNNVFQISNNKKLSQEEKTEKINASINVVKENLNKVFLKGYIVAMLPTEKEWYGSHFGIILHGEVYAEIIDPETGEISETENGDLYFFLDVIEGNVGAEENTSSRSVRKVARNIEDIFAVYRFLPEDYNLEFQGKAKKEYNNAEIIIKDPLT